NFQQSQSDDDFLHRRQRRKHWRGMPSAECCGWVPAICGESTQLIRRSGQCLKNEKRPAFRGPQWQETVRFVLQLAKVRTTIAISASSILRVDFQRPTEPFAPSLPVHISATTASIST